MIFVLTHYVSVFVIMSKKLSVVIDDELVKKLRNIQSMNIRKSKKAVSFSKIVNDELRKSI